MRLHLALVIAVAIAVALYVSRREHPQQPARVARAPTPHLPLALPASAPASAPAAPSRPVAHAAPPRPVSARASQPSVRVPIPMTEAHAQLFNRPLSVDPETGRPRMNPHEQLEHEPKDTTWAVEAELALGRFIAAKDGGGQVEIAAVECRQTVCEIQAFTDGELRWPDMVAGSSEAFPHLFSSVLVAFVSPNSPRNTAIAYVYRAERRL